MGVDVDGCGCMREWVWMKVDGKGGDVGGR